VDIPGVSGPDVTDTIQKLSREIERLDPVGRDELDGVESLPSADDLLARIVASEAAGDDAPSRRRPGRRRFPRLALIPLAVALAVAAAMAISILGKAPHGGGGELRADYALKRAADAASSRSLVAAERPYSFLKTREVSVETRVAEGRPWSIYSPSTREEWIAEDGSRRLRTVSGPARFTDRGERQRWEAAGRPGFLPLQFERRTEDRWLPAGTPGRESEELPVGPAALAEYLEQRAEADPGGLSVPAATLRLTAEYLRDPDVTPRLRGALYEAAARVPGVEYLGRRRDPEGRIGTAIGVTGSGGRRRFSLIFDAASSAVFATELTSLGPAAPGAPRLLREQVFQESRGLGSESEFGHPWLSGFDSSASVGLSNAAYLVYRVPNRQPWLRPVSSTLYPNGGTG
jgi:hypothetical protein